MITMNTDTRKIFVYAEASMTAIHWQKLASAGVEMRIRHPFDFYPTDDEHVVSGLDCLPANLNPVSVLDAGAGMGIWGQFARQRWPMAMIAGVEINPNIPSWNYYTHTIRQDFLSYDFGDYRFDVSIGNPPYKLAEDFVRKSISLLKPAGYLVYLLRLSFLESIGRYSLFVHEHTPKKVVVCSDRPSFTGDGKTDSSAYAFFVWQKGYTGQTAIEWSISKAANQDKTYYQQRLAI